MFKTFISSLVYLSIVSTTMFAEGIEQAQVYRQNSSLQWNWAMTALAHCTWAGNERVLDVGAGDGKLTAEVLSLVPQGLVVGLDISTSMLDLARKSYPSQQHRNLIFLKGDAALLPFTEQFDVVVSFCTLHWVIDQMKALRGIAQSLVQGGHALLVTPAPAPNNVATLAEQLAQTEKWRAYFPSFSYPRVYFTASEYERMLQEVGFRDISVTETESLTTYASKHDLIEWLHPLLNYTRNLPKVVQEDYLNDLADRMLTISPPAEDGSIVISHQKLEVQATKA